MSEEEEEAAHHLHPVRPVAPLSRDGGASPSIGGGGGCAALSENSCRWSTSSSFHAPYAAHASRSDVVVGVEVAYIPPLTPLGEGAVLGITKIHCADATKVASGDNTATMTILVGLPAPESADTGALSAPKGAYALDGFQVAYTDHGATQIAASYRPFALAQDSGTRAFTPPLPPMETRGSSMASLGCYSPSAVLFLQGFNEASTVRPPMAVGGSGPPSHPRLQVLIISCTDYTDAFQRPDDQKVACCLGKGHDCWWGGYTPHTVVCDEVMGRYCLPQCSGGVCADPACGCLGSPLAANGVAQCFDARCADNAGAYRARSMFPPNCQDKALSCVELAALGNPAFVAKGVQPPTGCGGGGGDPGGGSAWLGRHPVWVIVFLVCAILLAYSLRPSRRLEAQKGAPLRPPPGALPPLPPLMSTN